MVKMMQPREDGYIHVKMKTLKRFEPDRSTAPLDKTTVIRECIESHDDLLNLIEQSRDVDINRVRVVSAIGPIIRFKLGDCFRFNTAHHLRHLLQADNVMAESGFPEG